MQKNPRHRLRTMALTVLLVLGAAGGATGCIPGAWTWQGGETHGAIIEPTAGRASLGIYRAARKALRDVYGSGGIRQVQNYIWAYGQPPSFTKTFTFRGRSITTSFGTAALRSHARSAIYADPADLRGALLESHARGDCLALTLLSYGTPTRNWTHKSVGCRTGSLR